MHANPPARDRWQPDIGGRAAIDVAMRNLVPVLGVTLLAWSAATTVASFLLDAALMTATSVLVLSGKHRGNRVAAWLRWPAVMLLSAVLLLPHALAAWLLTRLFGCRLEDLVVAVPGSGFWLGLLLQAFLQWHTLYRDTCRARDAATSSRIALRIAHAWLRIVLAGAVIAWLAVFQPWWPSFAFRVAVVAALAAVFSACEIYPDRLLRWLRRQGPARRMSLPS
jgi:hypothetical protein